MDNIDIIDAPGPSSPDRPNVPSALILPEISPSSTTRDITPAALLEQLMRITDDDTVVLTLWRRPVPQDARAGELGRLLSHTQVPLTAGSPLLVWAAGHTPDPCWREHCPVSEKSLWAAYEFLCSLHFQSTHSVDPFQKFLDLRAQTT